MIGAFGFSRAVAILSLGAANFVASAPASAQDAQCLSGELPYNARPLEMVLPSISLDCWRAPREGDGRGVWFRIYFDVAPDGSTENIHVEAVDPACAKEGVEKMASEWRFDCSEKGRKSMKYTMTLNSSVN